MHANSCSLLSFFSSSAQASYRSYIFFYLLYRVPLLYIVSGLKFGTDKAGNPINFTFYLHTFNNTRRKAVGYLRTALELGSFSLASSFFLTFESGYSAPHQCMRIPLASHAIYMQENTFDIGYILKVDGCGQVGCGQVICASFNACELLLTTVILFLKRTSM